jgi:thioredoxin reductase (NADPH)
VAVFDDVSQPFDALIVGAGPAGLSVAERLQRDGLRIAIAEKGPIGAHIAEYPTFMRFFSTNQNLELAGFPLAASEEKPTRAEYLAYLASFARYHRLPLETYARVTAIQRASRKEPFAVTIERHARGTAVVPARHVVLACGAWEAPRRLGVPGEDLPKVHRRFTEAHGYIGRQVAVIGGRNSAVETALLLHRAGALVTIIHRGADFQGRGVKYWLKPDIENRVARGEIRGILNAHVVRIGQDHLLVQEAGRDPFAVRNDFVLPMIGYDPPVEFLRAAGVHLAEGTHRPAINPATLESNVPGLYIAGVITAGNISAEVFIENMRHHGDLIAAHIGGGCPPKAHRGGGPTGPPPR